MSADRSAAISSCCALGSQTLTACKYRSRRSMVRLLENRVQRCIDALPLGEELLQHQPAVGRQLVKALVPFVFLAPLAGEQSLAFEPAKQGVQRPLVDAQSKVAERVSQRVAVRVRPERGEDSETQASAAELEAEILEYIRCVRAFTRRHILSIA